MAEQGVAEVARALTGAGGIVVLTGAGVSAESGLRTFRSASAADLPEELRVPDMQALWKEFDPARLATPEAFEADPAMVSRWYDWRRLGCLNAEPNPGHVALAKLEAWATARGVAFTLLTQNVDRLHQRAGSRNVVELHGSIIQWRCTRSGRKVTPGGGPQAEFPVPSPFVEGAFLRPDVVWFGEMLPEEAIDVAGRAVDGCDCFLSVGTSAVVYPAAGFIHAAAMRGAFTCEVNAEATPLSPHVDVTLRGRSGQVLPALVEAVGGEGPP